MSHTNESKHSLPIGDDPGEVTQQRWRRRTEMCEREKVPPNKSFVQWMEQMEKVEIHLLFSGFFPLFFCFFIRSHMIIYDEHLVIKQPQPQSPVGITVRMDVICVSLSVRSLVLRANQANSLNRKLSVRNWKLFCGVQLRRMYKCDARTILRFNSEKIVRRPTILIHFSCHFICHCFRFARSGSLAELKFRIEWGLELPFPVFWMAVPCALHWTCIQDGIRWKRV